MDGSLTWGRPHPCTIFSKPTVKARSWYGLQWSSYERTSNDPQTSVTDPPSTWVALPQQRRSYPCRPIAKIVGSVDFPHNLGIVAVVVCCLLTLSSVSSPIKSSFQVSGVELFFLYFANRVHGCLRHLPPRELKLTIRELSICGSPGII